MMQDGKVRNENSELLDLPGASIIFLNGVDGITNKLTVAYSGATGFSSNIYTLPGLTIEHNYTEGHAIRSNFSGVGERYILLDAIAKEVNIYNGNHTLLKTVTLTNIPANAQISPISFVVNELNNDSKIEIGINYYTVGGAGVTYTGRIINEDGVLLLSRPNSTFFSIDNIQGLTPKLTSTDLSGFSLFSSGIYNFTPFVFTGLSNLSEKGRFWNVSPVPAQNTISINGTTPNRLVALDIIDITGKTVKSFYNIHASSYTFDVSNLHSGLYMLRGQTSDNTWFTKKIVVE